MGNTKKNKNVYILIPAFLEEPTIRSVVTDIQKRGYENIIVVDDGSSDNTYEQLLHTKNVIAIRHIINRGKGAGVRTGMEVAKLRNAQIVVTMDGDGQHNPDNIEALVRALDDGTDVALGTRKENLKNMPFIKKIANFFGNFFTTILFGINVSDSQCGFRAYSRKAIDMIETTIDRYGYDTEVLREIKRNNLTYKEIPVETIYNAHSQTKAERQTFMNGIRTLIKMIFTS